VTRSAFRAAAILLAAAFVSRCGRESPAPAAQPIYNKKTGELERLIHDSNRNGVPDAWSYMQGTRINRIEIDGNEDGRVERWEFYGDGGRLEKVGFSRRNDGQLDAWAFSGPDGQVSRIDISLARNGKVDRTEWYESGELARVEEDTDHDGLVDKWETRAGTRVLTVAFDENADGAPDRRLTYGSGGALLTIESDPDGRGGFLKKINPASPAPRPLP
jgi:hypothetical protein